MKECSEKQEAGSRKKEAKTSEHSLTDSHSSFQPSQRPPAKSFTDLEIWQKAHTFVLNVYRLTAKLPADERFGLCSQFRRAAVSIPANIAEGFRKFTPADKARFLNIAEGSLEECRYYCILIGDLGYGNTEELKSALNALAPQLARYINKLRR